MAEARQTTPQPIPGSAQAARRTLPLADLRPALCQSDRLLAAFADLGPDIRILALAYPEFTISECGPGRNGPTWAVIRENPGRPGLYAAVTHDLAELRDVLALHASQQPANNPRDLPTARAGTGNQAQP